MTTAPDNELDTRPEADPPLGLWYASVAYLAFPYILFALGWLNAAAAAWLMAATVVGAALSAKAMGATATVREHGRRFRWWIPVVLLTIVWTSFSGMGGHGVQNLMDYAKHNAILGDLVDKDWPVRYDAAVTPNGRPATLVYYVAFYLPAAAVGKLAGWRAANETLFAWGTLGAFLAIAWFRRTAGRRGLLVPLLFIFAGGLDVLGYWMYKGFFPPPLEHLEHWSTGFQYSSITTLLYWVPQHAIAGWLLAGMLVEEYRARRSANVAFLTALSMLWSPMVTIGLLPFALLAAVSGGIRKALTFQNLVAAAMIAGITAAFFAPASSQVAGHFIFAWKTELPQLQLSYLFFVLLEFGLYAAVMATFPRTYAPPRERLLRTICLVVLFLLPLYLSGTNNDLTMRASIPALFIFWSFVIRAIVDGRRKPDTHPAAIALVLLLCMSAMTAVNEIAWGAFGSWDDHAAGIRWRNVSRDDVATGGPRTVVRMREDWYIPQYLGSEDSFFFRYLARRSAEDDSFVRKIAP
ncbi:MAG TPA: hypothetical protein VL500_03740 [Candidatus Eisenbacteria bacterium]|nr:hypothetical protein [Candidatus Eisenbacteria bacterium]